MRIQYKRVYNGTVGYCGEIVGHTNNTLKIILEEGAGKGNEVLDLYWNWEPLDDEAKEYMAEVERTAIPMTTPLNDD